MGSRGSCCGLGGGISRGCVFSLLGAVGSAVGEGEGQVRGRREGRGKGVWWTGMQRDGAAHKESCIASW